MAGGVAALSDKKEKLNSTGEGDIATLQSCLERKRKCEGGVQTYLDARKERPVPKRKKKKGFFHREFPPFFRRSPGQRNHLGATRPVWKESSFGGGRKGKEGGRHERRHRRKRKDPSVGKRRSRGKEERRPQGGGKPLEKGEKKKKKDRVDKRGTGATAGVIALSRRGGKRTPANQKSQTRFEIPYRNEKGVRMKIGKAPISRGGKKGARKAGRTGGCSNAERFDAERKVTKGGFSNLTKIAGGKEGDIAELDRGPAPAKKSKLKSGKKEGGGKAAAPEQESSRTMGSCISPRKEKRAGKGKKASARLEDEKKLT